MHAISKIIARHAQRDSVEVGEIADPPIFDPQKSAKIEHTMENGLTAELNGKYLEAESLYQQAHQMDPADLELARLAYLKWGRDVCNHLVGDFAFCVWDERERVLFAVRDHLGLRPLYHQVTSDGVVLASDFRQILRLAPNDCMRAQPIGVRTPISRDRSPRRCRVRSVRLPRVVDRRTT